MRRLRAVVLLGLAALLLLAAAPWLTGVDPLRISVAERLRPTASTARATHQLPVISRTVLKAPAWRSRVCCISLKSSTLWARPKA